MREPKKVRTEAELIKSCRMLREHNERLKATIKRVEDAVASHEEGLGDMVVAEIALALAGETK